MPIYNMLCMLVGLQLIGSRLDDLSAAEIVDIDTFLIYCKTYEGKYGKERRVQE